MFISCRWATKATTTANKRIKPISQDKQLTFLRFFILKRFSFIFTTFFFLLHFLFMFVPFTRFASFNPFKLFFSSAAVVVMVVFFSLLFSAYLFTFICAFGYAREKVPSIQKILLIFCNYLLFITFSCCFDTNQVP